MTISEKTKLVEIASRLRTLAKRHEDDDLTDLVKEIHQLVQPK